MDDAELLVINRKIDREPNTSLDALLSKIKLHDTYAEAQDNTDIKKDKQNNKQTDKKNRATCEQVLDPRTKMILLKLIKNNILYSVNGCMSTGKEANVYHGVVDAETSLALKIFKTSILVFKDRHIYVDGDFRFRTGYKGNNPRKMVRMWAEKEFKNLKLLEKAGIPAPRALFIKQHVLAMTFVGDGKEGIPAPRLKNWLCSPEEMHSAYRQSLKLLRSLFQNCRLVHADLSEYNLLVSNSRVYVIDVSQAVENDSPQALAFLRRDCKNILAFFRLRQLRTISTRQLFDFVTDATVFDDDAVLDAFGDTEESDDEFFFLHSYVPRTLHELEDTPEAQAQAPGSLYAKVTGIESLAVSQPVEKKPRPEATTGSRELDKKERQKIVKQHQRERRRQKKEENTKKKKRTHKAKRK